MLQNKKDYKFAFLCQNIYHLFIIKVTSCSNISACVSSKYFLCSNISACTCFRKLSASSNISACTFMRGDTV